MVFDEFKQSTDMLEKIFEIGFVLLFLSIVIYTIGTKFNVIPALAISETSGLISFLINFPQFADFIIPTLFTIWTITSFFVARSTFVTSKEFTFKIVALFFSSGVIYIVGYITQVALSSTVFDVVTNLMTITPILIQYLEYFIMLHILIILTGYFIQDE